MAAQLAVQTGNGKDPDEMFPGFVHFARMRGQADA
jgi:secreted Zn-dependent insulinase-like peptidase